MSADLAVQRAVRARLVATAELVALVPALSILDVNQRPAPVPSIIIGEGQTLEGDRTDRRDQRIVLGLHVWKKEPGLRGVKEIAGAIRKAILSARLADTDGYQFGDCRVPSMRFLRDPDGETSHAVVTVETLACEAG